MQFQVLIPARLASSRLPNKPLLDLGGVPMIVRVAKLALASQAYRVVVATDHPAIEAACCDHGISVVMTRPDHESGTDRLAEACELLGLSDDDCIVNLQGDEPCMAPALIDACAQALLSQSMSPVATVAAPIESVADWHNPNIVKVVCDNFARALYFSRAPIPYWRSSQQQAGASLACAAFESGQSLNNLSAVPPQALRHLGLYAYRAGFLKQFAHQAPSALERLEMLEQLRILCNGASIVVHISQSLPPAGVDSPEDLARVRKHLALADTHP